jgi:uncharacterized protein (DUF1800 family)
MAMETRSGSTLTVTAGGRPSGASDESGAAPALRRRRILRSALAALGGASAAVAAAREARADTPIDPRASWVSLEKRLVRRVTNGLTPAEASRAVALGYAAYLEAQLAAPASADAAVERWVAANYPLLSQSAAELFAGRVVDAAQQLNAATLYRAIFSNRQLYQRMVEFWTDHFNIDFRKVNSLKLVDDREAIRPNALRTFPLLLRASAHSPAMLMYLDNAISRRESPNLNYGRELLELHTMGVDGGYTEEDVRDVSRCFTGWTLDRNQSSPTFGTFVYDPRLHDDGRKRVLGHTIAAGGGQHDGETVLNILAAHPSTARFIAAKMTRWLLDESAPSSVVEAAAAVYRSTRGDIRSMIRSILSPENLAAAPAKMKRPFHLAVSAFRALAPAGVTVEQMSLQVGQMGQPLYQWIPPNGYPDTAEHWSGLMTARWNFATWISYATPAALPALTTFRTARAAADAFDAALFAGEMPANEKSELIAYMRPDAPTSMRLREGLGLALAAPGFQWF